MHSGAYEVLLIRKGQKGQELFRATGSGKLSLAFMKSYRIITGCTGLCTILSTLSVVALVQVVRRRFELFSSVFLIHFAAASVAISYLQIKLAMILYFDCIG